jgi:hypothetical protein
LCALFEFLLVDSHFVFLWLLLRGCRTPDLQGFAFGTGSAVAHRAVGAVAGSMGGSGEGAQEQQQQQHQMAPAAQFPQACEQDKTSCEYAQRVYLLVESLVSCGQCPCLADDSSM